MKDVSTTTQHHTDSRENEWTVETSNILWARETLSATQPRQFRVGQRTNCIEFNITFVKLSAFEFNLFITYNISENSKLLVTLLFTHLCQNNWPIGDNWMCQNNWHVSLKINFKIKNIVLKLILITCISRFASYLSMDVIISEIGREIL